MRFGKHLKRMPDNKIRQLYFFINALYWLFAAPFVVFFVLLCLPVVGNIVALAFGQSIGCEFSEREAEPCFVFGVNLGEIFYGYLAGMFLLGIGNPVMFVRAIFALSATFEIWFILISVCCIVLGRKTIRFETLRRMLAAKVKQRRV